MTIGTRLMAGILASFALSALLAFFGFHTVGQFRDLMHETASKTIVKVRLAGKLRYGQSEMVSSQRGLILAAFAKNPAELETYRQAFLADAAEMRKDITELRGLARRQEVLVLLSDIEAKLAEWLPHFSEVVSQAKLGDIEAANKIRTDITAPLYKAIGADAVKITTVEEVVLNEDTAKAADTASNAAWISTLLTVLCGVAGVAGIFSVRSVNQLLRRTIAQLLAAAEEVTGASTQVASSSQSLAQGSSEQAASLEETNATSREISSTAAQNAERSAAAADIVSVSQKKFAAANASLDEMLAAMSGISSSSEKISRIIRVIDEIAFQTNILALNAAVEAARAGDAGMGFAVVADEVRNLAQRSATAARDTAALIEGSIAASQGGTVRVNGVTTAIRDIAEEIIKVKQLVDELSEGSREQTHGTETIGRSLSQIEQVTQRAAASAEQSAAAAQELNAQSNEMKRVVMELAAMVGNS